MKAKERVKVILDAYFDEHSDFCRFTSQDVCDNLRDIAELTPDQVTDYLLDRGWQLFRKDDRLVWGD